MKQYKFWDQLKDNKHQINWISPNTVPFKIVPCCISTKIPMTFLPHHPHHPKFLNTMWRNMGACSSDFSCISYTVTNYHFQYCKQESTGERSGLYRGLSNQRSFVFWGQQLKGEHYVYQSIVVMKKLNAFPPKFLPFLLHCFLQVM